MINWRFAPFEELTPREAHDLYRLRAAAFIVEQNCVFQDVDGLDPQCWHLLGYASSSASGEGQLVAYCRLLPAGAKYAEPSIGRVVTAQAMRGSGLGRELMREALLRTEKLWPKQPLRIGAQRHLERFYEDFGFAAASQPYDEDGILHIEMLRPVSAVADKSGRKVGHN